MPKLLIVGDPTGSTSLDAINNRGWSPEDITVWENDSRHVYAIKCISGIIDIILDDNKLTKLKECAMKFDVIIGNPPYQAPNDSGNKRGSGYKALWYEFSKLSFDLLKDGGVVTFITPESAFTGSERFTSLLSGPNSKVDLAKVNFNLNKHFSGVGINICRWVAYKNKTDGFMTDVDGRMINAKSVFKLYKDEMVQSIVNTLSAYDGPKLKFSVSGQYNYAAIEDNLRKLGKDISPAKDITTNKSETHKYYLIDNGVIKYTSILHGKDYTKPRVFLSRMKNPYIVMASDCAMNTESTMVMYFDTIEEASSVSDMLDSPFTRKVISLMTSNGRISGGDISQLPSISLEDVLSYDQVNYIKEQLT